jgi:colanic acid/amylovoran biosynthesis glycosyltransferase
MNIAANPDGSAAAKPDPASATGAAIAVAYLVNQYPKVSHTFIRREIRALEQQGVAVMRFALRGWDADVTDRADIEERARTRYVLEGGPLPLAVAVAATILRAPVRFARALSIALRMSRRSPRSWPYHLIYLAEAAWLCQQLRAAGVDHLHAHFGTNGAEVALLVRELGGPPYSFTVHGPEEFDAPEALHLRAKIEKAAFVIAISSFGRSQLYRWIAVDQWPKVRVVHCGLDAQFDSSSASPTVAAARLVCVGRLCEQKGQLLLLDAVKIVVDRGKALTLVLAGDGELREAIEGRIEALGLQEHVGITGWIDSERVRVEMLAARALVLPSFAEGLPVVIMEAMALRRPVLSTFVAGIAELVRPGLDGWLVPAGDVQALADAIEECLETAAPVMARMGDDAHERVLARHSIAVGAAKLAELFREGAIRAAVHSR